MSDTVHIRPLAPSEIPLAVEWAAAEGWNPGLADAACFATVDPHGFWCAEVDGAPAAVISVVNYDASFAFLGFYIVKPEQRGRGIGFRLWQAGLAHAGPRTIGLDGVVAQQANYARQGFELAWRNIRFAGRVQGGEGGGACVDLADVPFARIEASDARVFPAARRAFLESWIGTPGHVGRALLRDGELAGWGVVRPAREGWKVAPLVARDEAAAQEVFSALCAQVGDAPVSLDIAEPNRAAEALARRVGLSPLFETARMYRGPAPVLALDEIYGVTSFELG
ncbi:GNAT family N-acetyltransferase [Ancylobacter sp. A5.8]|uniref:GNAT family N-acetyltransferase n=1 Tax=Ancylobacter gelatini TaxID=2919920 RepID=UPI001F4E75E6|nr:GNAT family N-acetyltransferase [Ancylobacter gelatini]MCJ8144797.1 GNAT family N-acetyltransferase [Ancylobacter gelatini]